MHRQESNIHRSITALSVVHSLNLCAKNERLSHLVDHKLAALNEFVLKSLIKDYPISKGWLVYKGLSIFPANFQKKIMDHCGGIGAPQHIAMRKLLIEHAAIEKIRAENILVENYYLLSTTAPNKDNTYSHISEVPNIEILVPSRNEHTKRCNLI